MSRSALRPAPRSLRGRAPAFRTGAFPPAPLGRALAALLAAALFAGCGDDELSPVAPEGPNLSTVQGAILALEEYYSFQKASGAISLLGNSYAFIPALPESVRFLPDGTTSWTLEVEKDILEQMLVPERLSWLDQVLLEVSISSITEPSPGVKVVEARVELGLLESASSWLKGVSKMQLTFGVDADGNHLLVEERESLPDDYEAGVSVLVSQQKAKVLPLDYTP